jgi:hypothetical protein
MADTKSMLYKILVESEPTKTTRALLIRLARPTVLGSGC